MVDDAASHGGVGVRPIVNDPARRASHSGRVDPMHTPSDGPIRPNARISNDDRTHLSQNIHVRRTILLRRSAARMLRSPTASAGRSLYDTPSWEGATSSIQCGSVWNEAVRNFAEAYG